MSTEWIDKVIKDLLQIDLKSSQIPQNSPTPIPTPLPNYLQELESQNLPLLFSLDQLDNVIQFRLSLPSNAHPKSKPLFSYLLDCWKRCHLALSKVKHDDKSQVINQIKQLVLSYSGLVTNPDLQEAWPQSPLILSQNPGFISQFLPDNLPREYLMEFIDRFSDELQVWFHPIFKSLTSSFRSTASLTNTSSSKNDAMKSILYLLSFKQIAIQVTKWPDFNPPANNLPAKTMEITTLLGPLFSGNSCFSDADKEIPSLFPANVSPDRAVMEQPEGYWERGFLGRNPQDVLSLQNSLRTSMQLHQDYLFQMCDFLFKSDVETRQDLLNYFITAILRNLSREKIQVDWSLESTHAFLYGLSRVCLKFSLPIYDSGKYSRLNLLENGVGYFMDEPWKNVWKEWTKMLFTQEESMEYSSRISSKSHHFVTNIFFITVTLLHVGPQATFRYYSGLVKSLHDARQPFLSMLSQRDSNPLVNMQCNMFMKRLDEEFGNRLGMEIGLFDVTFTTSLIQFYNLVMVWLYKTALGGLDNPDSIVKGFHVMKPWDIPTNDWKAIPEWFIDDICEFYIFQMRFNMDNLLDLNWDEMVTFCITLLLNHSHLRNPYSKSKLVEMLYYLTVPLYRGRDDNLADVFYTNPTAKEYLVRVLTKWYVDVESTGTHTQFYDKFNARYNISQILKTIWNHQGHREKIVNLSKDHDFFVKFVNLLINDTTYLFDEALGKLQEIRNIEKEMDSMEWNMKTQQERDERIQLLQQDERMANTFMSLTNETVHMLNYLTEDDELIGPFMTPEIVDRLTAMMDYNLQALVGPKCSELRVKNPEKYHFRPKELLNELVGVYLHLLHRDEFVKGIVKDERSFSKQIFIRAGGILIKANLKPSSDLQPLLDLVHRVETLKKEIGKEEEELGDVPEEFEDPLMATIMTDPVILPSSKKIVDRSTIKQHLLSDAHDPFNRQPLKIEDVVSDLELKKRIEEWKAKARER